MTPVDGQDLDARVDRDRLTALQRVVAPGGVVVDVGANRGQFAVQLLSVTTCQVHAFEPVPEAFVELERIGRALGGITAHQCAIAEHDGSSSLHIMASDVGSSLLRPRDGRTAPWLSPVRSVDTATRRLDSFLADEGIDVVSLLKCDAQGYDARVLRSAGRFLNPASITAVLVEASFVTAYEDQDALHDVVALLDAHGYRLAAVFPHLGLDGWLSWADMLYLPRPPEP